MAKVVGGGGAGAAYPTVEPTGVGFTAGTAQAKVLQRGERALLTREARPSDFDAMLGEGDRRLTSLEVPRRCWDGWPINHQTIADLLLQNRNPTIGATFPFDDKSVAEFDQWRGGSEGQGRSFKQLNETNWTVMARWVIRAIPHARVDQLFGLGRLLGIAEANLRHPERFIEVQGHKVKEGLGTAPTDPFVQWTLEQYQQRRDRGDEHMKACRGVLNDPDYEKRRTAAGKVRRSLNTFQKWIANNSG